MSSKTQSEFEGCRYAKKFVGHWQSHPCHKDKLTLKICPNGEVTLQGTVRRYQKKQLRRSLPLVAKNMHIDRTFSIRRCEYSKGAIQCVVVNRHDSEEHFVLADDHLIYGNYHLYKDCSIKHMVQERSVRESRRSLRLSDVFQDSESDVAVEFEPLPMPALIVDVVSQFQRNSFVLDEKTQLITPSTTRGASSLGDSDDDSSVRFL